MRIDNICETWTQLSIGTGAGFLIAPNLVATVAHVVEDDGALRVTSPVTGIAVSARVVGLDHQDDLALIQTSARLPGHIFSFSADAPPIGTDMAAIGFPLGRSMQLSPGHVTGTHDHRTVGGVYDLSDVVLSDAAVNHGNSGGPWITMDGNVIALDESGPPFDQDGVHAEGNNGGVSGVNAARHFKAWEIAPDRQADRGCQPAADTAAATETLELYFFAINVADYATAFAQEDPRNHPLSGLTGFRNGVESSTDTASDGSGAWFDVNRTSASGTAVFLDASFRSHQRADQGPNGETCTDWTLRYKFVSRHGLQLIESSPAQPGTAGHTAC